MISWKNRVVKTMLATAPRMRGPWGVATAIRWDDRTTIVDGEYVKQLTPVPDDEILGGAARLVDAASGLAFHVTPPWNAARSTGYVLVPAVPARAGAELPFDAQGSPDPGVVRRARVVCTPDDAEGDGTPPTDPPVVWLGVGEQVGHLPDSAADALGRSR